MNYMLIPCTSLAPDRAHDAVVLNVGDTLLTTLRTRRDVFAAQSGEVVPTVLTPPEVKVMLNCRHPDFNSFAIFGPKLFSINPQLMPDVSELGSNHPFDSCFRLVFYSAQTYDTEVGKISEWYVLNLNTCG